MTIAPLSATSTRRCDCESSPCAGQGYHREGACSKAATVAVTLYGMKTVLCDSCAEEAARLQLASRGRI